jgi:putative nucleotidyltransferase with HDIG domain
MEQNKNQLMFEEKKKTFVDILQHLLEDEQPSFYMNQILSTQIFREKPFSMLYKLKDTKQSPIHHPEGNAWNHTMLVVNEAAKVRNQSKNPEVFMCAALLHDIGKPETTRNRKGKITSYDHDIIGAERTKEFLELCDCKNEFIDEVVKLVRYHMHILYVLKNLSFGKIDEMMKQVDINELALIGLCDRLGRLNVDRKQEEDNIREFLDKCK